MKNRMRELRTCGTVRGEGHEVLAYSEKKVPRLWITLHGSSSRFSGSGAVSHRVVNLRKRNRWRVRYGLKCFGCNLHV